VTDSGRDGFSRRAFLKTGAAGLALVALASFGLAAQRTRLRAAPSAGLKVLSQAEYSILAAIAARFCPAPAPGVPGADEMDVALLADRLFERAEDDIQAGLKLALHVVESPLTGAALLEHTAPFTQLSPEKQDSALEWFRISRVALRRTIYRSMSGLVGALYYGDPRSWPGVGYPGPPDPAALRRAYSAQLVDLASLRAKPQVKGG
jgi:hypothetical protein